MIFAGFSLQPHCFSIPKSFFSLPNNPGFPLPSIRFIGHVQFAKDI